MGFFFFLLGLYLLVAAICGFFLWALIFGTLAAVVGFIGGFVGAALRDLVLWLWSKRKAENSNPTGQDPPSG